MTWANWKEIRLKSKNKKVFFYGRSEDWIPKSYKQIKPDYIVDINFQKFRNKYYDTEIKNPSFFINFKLPKIIIITNSDFINVKNQLIKKGIDEDIIFFCPEFKDFQNLLSLRSLNFELIFTSPDYKSGKVNRVSNFGGGIFNFKNINNKTLLKKRISGNYRGITLYKGKYFAVEYIKARIDIFTKNFKKIKSIKLPNPGFCGICINPKNDDIFVANSSTDMIVCINKNGKILYQIPFGKLSKEDSSQSRYHINDLTLESDDLFISYFSASGFWRNDVFDGGVSSINLNTLDRSTLINNLYQPHSPKLINGSLHILDSFRGKLVRGNNIISSFPGFVRGLDFHNDLYFIGQSETMYMSKKKGLSNNIMNNSGFWVLDPDTFGTRFYNTPGVCNIHDFLVIDSF